MINGNERGIREFRVCNDPFRAVAESFADLMRTLEGPSVALSGGSTPRHLYTLWSKEFAKDIPWSAIQIFQVDERCVPPEDPASNWKLLTDTLLDSIPEAQAFRIEVEDPNAAEAYEDLLRQHVPPNENGIPRLDLVLLGMGADGHTASLFPGTSALEERTHLVVRNEAPHLEHPRITLTFPVLEAAHRRWFLVTGFDKAEAVAAAQRGENPAGRLDGVWYLDAEAAGRL